MLVDGASLSDNAAMDRFSAPNSPVAGDLRFSVALYTQAEAARALDVPPTTFARWARRVPEAVVTALSTVDAGQPSVPFVGLAEGLVLAALRRTGIPLQRIRPALAALTQGIGVEHALASRALYTDGAEVLFDFAEHAGEREAAPARELVVVRSGQPVFTEAVEQYLRRIDYAPDGYARLLHLPGYTAAEVVADPTRSFGQPIFARGGVRVSDVLERFWTGEHLDTLAEEFGVPVPELEDLLRVASRRAA